MKLVVATVLVSVITAGQACAPHEQAEAIDDSSSQIRDADGNEVITANRTTRIKTSADDSSELDPREWCELAEGATITIADPVEVGKHVRGRLVSAQGCDEKEAFKAGLTVYLFRAHFNDWTPAAPNPDFAGVSATCTRNASFEARFMAPLRGVVTSRFGDCRDGCRRAHAGIDIAASPGTIIKAAEDGVVIDARIGQGACGTVLEIQHPNGATTRFCHNQALLVKKGDCVSRGQAVARVGNTGVGTGPHMHLEYYPTVTGGPVDPARIFGL